MAGFKIEGGQDGLPQDFRLPRAGGTDTSRQQGAGKIIAVRSTPREVPASPIAVRSKASQLPGTAAQPEVDRSSESSLRPPQADAAQPAPVPDSQGDRRQGIHEQVVVVTEDLPRQPAQGNGGVTEPPRDGGGRGGVPGETPQPDDGERRENASEDPIDLHLRFVTETDVRAFGKRIDKSRPAARVCSQLLSVASNSDAYGQNLGGWFRLQRLGEAGIKTAPVLPRTSIQREENIPEETPRAVTFESLATAVDRGYINTKVGGLGTDAEDFLVQFVAFRRTLLSLRQNVVSQELVLSQAQVDRAQADDPVSIPDHIGKVTEERVKLEDARRKFRQTESPESVAPHDAMFSQTNIFLESVLDGDERTPWVTVTRDALSRKLIEMYRNDNPDSAAARIYATVAERWIGGKSLGEIKDELFLKDVSEGDLAWGIGAVATNLHQNHGIGAQGEASRELNNLLEHYSEPDRPSPAEPDRSAATVFPSGVDTTEVSAAVHPEADRAAMSDAPREVLRKEPTIETGYLLQLRPEIAQVLLDIDGGSSFKGGYSTKLGVDGHDVTITSWDLPQDRRYGLQPRNATSQQRHQAGLSEGWGRVSVYFDALEYGKSRRRIDTGGERKIAGYHYTMVTPSELSPETSNAVLADIFGLTEIHVKGARLSMQALFRKKEISPLELGKELGVSHDILYGNAVLFKTKFTDGQYSDEKILGATTEDEQHHQRLRLLTERLERVIERPKIDFTPVRSFSERLSRQLMEGDKSEREQMIAEARVSDIEDIATVIETLRSNHYKGIVGKIPPVVYDGEPGAFISQDLREGKITADEIPVRILRADVEGYPGTVSNFSVDLIETPLEQLPVPERAIQRGSLTTIQVKADLIGTDGSTEGEVIRNFTLYTLSRDADPATARVSDDYDPRLGYNDPDKSPSLLRVVSHPVDHPVWLSQLHKAQISVYGETDEGNTSGEISGKVVRVPRQEAERLVYEAARNLVNESRGLPAVTDTDYLDAIRTIVELQHLGGDGGNSAVLLRPEQVKFLEQRTQPNFFDWLKNYNKGALTLQQEVFVERALSLMSLRRREVIALQYGINTGKEPIKLRDIARVTKRPFETEIGPLASRGKHEFLERASDLYASNIDLTGWPQTVKGSNTKSVLVLMNAFGVEPSDNARMRELNEQTSLLVDRWVDTELPRYSGNMHQYLYDRAGEVIKALYGLKTGMPQDYDAVIEQFGAARFGITKQDIKALEQKLLKTNTQ